MGAVHNTKKHSSMTKDGSTRYYKHLSLALKFIKENVIKLVKWV